MHLRLTQVSVAKKAGLSQSVYSRAERGQLAGLTIGSLDRIADAIGGSLEITLRYQGALGGRLADAAHARLVEFVVEFLRKRGWDIELEFSFNVFGDRGSVDVLGWHARTRTLVIVEVKSRFADLQEMFLSLSRKVRLVPRLAHEELGWDPVAVGRVVLAYGTTENHAVVDGHAHLFESALPARAGEVRRWLAAPDGPFAGLWLVSGGVVRSPGRGRRDRPSS